MATMTVETQEMEMRIWDMGNTMCSSALHWWFSLIAGILRRVRNRGRDREREKARDREGGGGGTAAASAFSEKKKNVLQIVLYQ